MANLKEKIKTNYSNNSTVINRLGILAVAVVSAAVATLTGAIEPAVAVNMVTKVITFALGGV